MKRFMILLMLMLALAQPVFAATTVNYYVNTDTGNDTTGNGTVGTPWATLDKACTYVETNHATITAAGSDEWIIVNLAGAAPDSVKTTLDGVTTDATHQIGLICSPEYSRSTANGNGLTISDDNVYVDGGGGTWELTSTSADYQRLIYVGGASNSRIYNLQLRIADVNHIAVGVHVAATSTAVIKNVLVNSADAASWGFYLSATGTNAMDGFHCVVYGGDVAYWNAGGTARMTNCIGASTAGNAFFGIITKTNCISDDASAGEANGCQINVTPAFVDAAGGDFRLATGDAIAKDKGTDPTGMTNWIPGSVDINGIPRPQGPAWDIGAHEARSNPGRHGGNRFGAGRSGSGRF